MQFKRPWLYALVQATCGPPVRLIWRMRITGREHMPPDGGVIVVANHESYSDPFFLAAAFRRRLRYLTRGDLWRRPVLGAALDAFGCIKIDRGRGDYAAMDSAAAHLEAGHVLGIFPQGTIIPLPDRPWLRGAARLALRTGSPILPVALINTEKALRPIKTKIGFPSVHVVIGELIPVERAAATAAAINSLTGRMQRDVMTLQAPYGPPDHVDATLLTDELRRHPRD